ncbi:hypothetical protein [Nocardioides mangrovi]|uniref:PepSY domain-containing protein n=1 Tax=Nocardioides mangrovi TaxID=2874580 RepID=A0ABS7UJT9_9ACTN|nr:hypothetical protein [Nocardioides mangrovi]MBZ5741289.1 hypothetical protein [Nocardioides mangrovi]
MSMLQVNRSIRVREVPTGPRRWFGSRPDVGDYGWTGRVWRRWSGRRWASPVSSLQRELLLGEATPATWPMVPPDRLVRGLALAVERQVSLYGADVVYDGPHGVVVAYRRRVSHVLHFVMTLLTGGLWAFVWLGVALSAREERRRLEIDAWGHVWAVPLRSR